VGGESRPPRFAFFARKYGTNGSIRRLNDSDNHLPSGGRMTRKIKARLAGVVLFMTLCSVTVWAITWADEEFVCPVCKTKNTFSVVGSYGSYIYEWPSKYQYIFWPLTDEHVMYSCKKCYLSVFMWDFDKLSKEKLEEIRSALKGIEIKGNYKRYWEIPMSQRLEVAEKIYAVLKKDDDFWLQFYRVKGYHYAAQKDQGKADESRKKALDLATRMLNEKDQAAPKKELWLISGAMKHFLGDDKGALDDLNSALKTKYEDKQLDKEKNENGETNLSAFVKEYVEKIQSPQKPRLMQDQ
jgi:hypothetical protein